MKRVDNLSLLSHHTSMNFLGKVYPLNARIYYFSANVLLIDVLRYAIALNLLISLEVSNVCWYLNAECGFLLDRYISTSVVEETIHFLSCEGSMHVALWLPRLKIDIGCP